MRKITLLLIVTLLFTVNIIAKQKTVTGKWMLTKIEINGNMQDVYQEIEFKADGYISMMGRVFGKWNVEGKSLTIESDMVKEFAGVRIIEWPLDNELILVSDKDKMFFEKLNPQKVEEENKKSNLDGVWVIKTEEGTKYLTFELPHNFKTVTKTEYSTSKSSGDWYYNSKDKTIVFVAYDRQLRGKNIIISMSDKKLVLDNDGQKITAIKQEEQKQKDASEIERLKFTEEDFYTEDGDSKYEDDANKLPWKDAYLIYESLSEIKFLEYKMSSIVEDTKAFEEKNLTVEIEVDTQNEIVTLDNVFVGFDRSSLPNDTEMPTLKVTPDSYDLTNTPFPYDVYTFRVVDQNREITTTAGTFICTTVEFLGDFESRIKVWLINDKPGIVARLIIDKEGSFGDLDYTKYELIKFNK
jgi:hypothetical protein